MPKQKILIVDDDPDLKKGLNLRLRANHYDTVYASDGFSAVMMAQKERPNLIILDIGLPAGDGFVVLERLQKNATLASIPVIVLTARDPQTRQRRTAGGDFRGSGPAAGHNGAILAGTDSSHEAQCRENFDREVDGNYCVSPNFRAADYIHPVLCSPAAMPLMVAARA